MRVLTFTSVCGSSACDACGGPDMKGCPFCVSKMTGYEQLPPVDSFDMRGFNKAVKLAAIGGCTTWLISSKGEATLYPKAITDQLKHHYSWDSLGGPFPLIELQTNALQIGKLARLGGDWIDRQPLQTRHIAEWHRLGLNTIAISCVGINHEANSEVYHPEYPSLELTVRFLHDLGFSVRLCVMMLKKKGYVYTPDHVQEVIEWCKRNRVEQLTIRPIRRPIRVDKTPEGEFVIKHGLDANDMAPVSDWVNQTGNALLTISHGSNVTTIYDVKGQNIAVSDCLTVAADTDTIRTLIFWADGRITYDWQFPGAILA